MGTRSEIYVRDSDECIELWKHWDSYPKYMVPFFKEFAEFAKQVCGNETHWLAYPTDVAAILIAFDYDRKRRENKFPIEYGYLKPNIMPRGKINDFEYTWILTLQTKHRKITWNIKGYYTPKVSLSQEEIKTLRKLARKGKDLRQVSQEIRLEVDETIELNTSPSFLVLPL